MEISTLWTILELKKEISAKISVPESTLKLIFAGRVLKDQDLVSDYKILDGNTIHLVKSQAQAASQAPTSQSTGPLDTSRVEPAQPLNPAIQTPANNLSKFSLTHAHIKCASENI